MNAKRILRSPFLWLGMAIVLAFVVGQSVSGAKAPKKVDTSTVITAIQKAQVKSATLVDREQRVEIVLKDGTKQQSDFIDGQGVQIQELLQQKADAGSLPGGYNIKVPKDNVLLGEGRVLVRAGKVREHAGEAHPGGPADERVEGGGLGVPYKPDQVEPDVAAHVRDVCQRCAGHDLKLMMEPGRSIVGPAGALLTRVLYRKTTDSKEFVIVDAAMNDLIRPSLYQAFHEIVPLRAHMPGTLKADVVGPVCETGDFFARDREMANVLPGDFLALCTAGAYGFVLASNYNTRPRPAEVLVEGASWKFIRPRETYEDLVRGEE